MYDNDYFFCLYSGLNNHLYLYLFFLRGTLAVVFAAFSTDDLELIAGFYFAFHCNYVRFNKAVSGVMFDLCTFLGLSSLKVHLNPNSLNKSLHLFETHFAVLNLILTFL